MRLSNHYLSVYILFRVLVNDFYVLTTIYMYNDDNSLKSILKESYGGKMSECKKKKKPFSKLLAKVRESGNKYKDGGSAWDKVGDFFSGEGAKKTIRRTTGQEEPVEHESFDESLHPQLRKAMEFRKKKKRMGDF